MKKIYHLGTCNTCQKIISSFKLTKDWELIDIKKTSISVKEIEQMHKLAGSYEALFSRKSRQYTARNLKNKQLSESDYKALILEEYTFLKRPVILLNNRIFIGNTAEVVDSAQSAING